MDLFLILFIVSPILVIVPLCCISYTRVVLVKVYSLVMSFVIFFMSLFLYFQFDASAFGFQYIWSTKWLDAFNINYIVGVDGLSLFLLILTAFLIPFCILVSWESVNFRFKDFVICLFLIEFFLFNVFSVLDLFFFYIFFEAVLIPMFILIGVWGSRERKIHAAYQFFLYTLLGSLIMLCAIITIYLLVGSCYVEALWAAEFTETTQLILWLAFFLSLAVKIPMIPVHIWLPEAHVEAPTAGSVLLAGILLKMGGYGFLRFVLPVFPFACNYFRPLVFMLSSIAVIYASCTTLRQIDLKKIIAYSSVAHMNFVTVGIFSNSVQGIEGAMMLMISHGIVSSALFLCVGLLYERYGTRLLGYYGGIATLMPVFSIIFLIFSLANMGMPGTSSFIGEFLVLTGAFYINTWVVFFISFGVILGAAYSVWLYNRVCFGPLNNSRITKFSDLNERECAILFPFIILVFILGIFPDFIMDTLHMSVLRVIVLEKIW